MNQSINKIFLISLFVLISNTILSAQYESFNYNAVSAQEKIKEVKLDTSEINVRQIDSLKIRSYLKDRDFRYFEDPEDTKTLWEKLMDWIQRQIDKLFAYDSKNVSRDVIQYLLIILAVLGLIYGFYRNEIKGLFFGNKNINSLEIKEETEDIHSIDFDKLIDKAVQNKNYRYAIRLNYLRLLKILSDKQIINWKPDKTNREYLKEIKQHSLTRSVSVVTNDFENIWYGGYDIDKDNYSYLIARYKDVNSLLENYQ